MGLFSDNSAQLRRIERKLDAIIENLGIEVASPDAGFEDVRRLAESGRKIDAIKLYRQRTGTGLFDAKQAVEDMVA